MNSSMKQFYCSHHAWIKFSIFSSHFSLGPPETTQQLPPKEQSNDCINTSSNTISNTTATTSNNNVSEMVSRRKILSRSRDDLNLTENTIYVHEDEDTWHNKEKLFRVSSCFAKIIFQKINQKSKWTLFVVKLDRKFLFNFWSEEEIKHDDDDEDEKRKENKENIVISLWAKCLSFNTWMKESERRESFMLHDFWRSKIIKTINFG